MKDNPPAAADASRSRDLRALGIVPGEQFDSSKLKADSSNACPRSASTGHALVQDHQGRSRREWLDYTTKTGVYGTEYLKRAFVTAIGLGANRPQDAVYPTSVKDGEGRPYSGENKYVMHFAEGQLPPADGFWSLTMYGPSYFFVDNPLNRFSISARQNPRRIPMGQLIFTFRTTDPVG